MQKLYFLTFIITLALSGCATESHRSLTPQSTQAAKIQYNGQKPLISVGRFNNHSAFAKGIFANGEDRLSNQASTILITHLQQSNHFIVLERTNIESLKQESNYSKTQQNISGAKFIISGDVSEFGRKVVGDKQLWGILGKSKTQVAYANVSLNVISVETSEVIFSTQGAGEYALSSRDVLGFGSSSGYDSTLNGKVLSLAIAEAVDKLALAVESGILK